MAQSIRVVDDKPLKKYIMSEPSLDTLIKDPSLEEIMINGPDMPVYVYHRDYGTCETNLVMTEEQILEVILDLAAKMNDRIDQNKPFLDARMADGSRLNATIPPATPYGPTITIRKFRENPFSIIDLINLGTVSIDLAVQLWLFVEGEKNYPCNMLIIGGAGGGKTTTLNVLSAFIPMEDRVVVIEDTLELSFPERSNIIRMESKTGAHIGEEVTMNDLLKNSLRMRPDRIIVGEVRGSEAETLFNAMNIGHSAMGTLHANSPSESIARLTNPPMRVPLNMLPLIDLIIVEQKIRSGSSLKRRITSMVEIQKSADTGIAFSEIFSYNPKKDQISRTDVPMGKESELGERSGMTFQEMKQEKEEKKMILEYLIKNKINSFSKVQEVIQRYYVDPDSVLSRK
jgi:flagellar protein FlaI